MRKRITDNQPENLSTRAVPIFRNGTDRNGPERNPKTRNGPRDPTHAQDILPLLQREFELVQWQLALYIVLGDTCKRICSIIIAIQLLGCIRKASQQKL